MSTDWEHGVLRLWTGGTYSFPLAVAWRQGDDDWTELYRGKPSSDIRQATSEAEKAKAAFDEAIADLQAKGWTPTREEGRNLYFMRSASN